MIMKPESKTGNSTLQRFKSNSGFGVFKLILITIIIIIIKTKTLTSLKSCLSLWVFSEINRFSF